MPGFIKQMVIILVLVLLGFGGSLATKSLSMNNEPCMVRPMLIYLNQMNFITTHLSLAQTGVMEVVILLKIHLVEYVPNKKDDVNLKVFDMIKGINESKTLIEHISCEFRCEFDARECNSKQNATMISVIMSLKNQLNIVYVNKIMPGILAYMLASVIRNVRLVNT